MANIDYLMDKRPIHAGCKPVQKAFLESPLLGNTIYAPETLVKIHKLAQKYLDKFMNENISSDNLTDFPLEGKMQVAFSVINHAKNWEGQSASTFWEFLSAQYGYKENEFQLLIKKCIEEAFIQNDRYFFTDSGKKRYKSTVLMHSYSPKQNYFNFLDFIFDFYKNNLNYNLSFAEEMVEMMFPSLSKKLSQEIISGEETEIRIDKTAYRFQEGISKLLLNKPYFSSKLILRNSTFPLQETS